MSQRPNILICGTPGTGKTTTAEAVAQQAGYNHINVGQWVAEKGLHSGWDEEFNCWTIDEDKVCDAMEDVMAEGGNIVDHHGCEFFPERWFDLVLVLQADNTVLYNRLEKRGYNAHKIQENVECEIMMVILEEARENYKENIVRTLPSNTVEQLEANVTQIVTWIREQARMQ
uniref:Adenylate kinase isoenzyme 6 homolog n=1 Tax=Dunaliella tertiolecta TaxID=3047 RepID=A0A7S3QNR7_DUNTE